jgi:multiple sugar transport system substrate-binding protein
VVLKCAGWGDVEETKILPIVLQEFKKTHPSAEVELYRAPYNDYISKILTLFSAGMAPDVMAINGEDFPIFSSKDLYLDLRPFIEKDPAIKLTDFYPQALQCYTNHGALDALPRDIAPIAVVYYNKKKFDEAGLPYPKDSWNVEEFLKTARRLTRREADGRTSQFGFVEDWANWESWVYEFGGSLVDDVRKPTRCVLDSAEAVEAVQFRADLVNSYGVIPSAANITALGGLGNSDLFMNGSAVMFFSGIWLVPQFRNIKNFDWDVVEFPKGPKGRRAYFVSPTAYGILKTTRNPQLAYELVTFLAGRTAQSLMAKTGLTQPASKAIAGSGAFLDGQKPRSKGFLLDAVQYGVFRPFDPNAREWMDLVSSRLDQVWEGKKTAGEVLRQVAAEINKKYYPSLK